MLNFLECMEASKKFNKDGDVYIRAEGHVGEGVQNFVCGDGLACILTMAKLIVNSAEKMDMPMNIVYETIADECRMKKEGRGNADEC